MNEAPNHALPAPGSTAPGTSDRECLESWARHRDADSLQALVERYPVFVYSSALRRTGDAAQAVEVTRAVFLVLARRAHRLRKNTMLAGWLFHVTAVACRKLKGIGRLRRFWQWISRKPGPALPPDATLWTRLAPQIDRALERLRTEQRNAVLLCAFLNQDFASAAKILRTSERRVEKRVGRGMKKLANRLGKRHAAVDPGALVSACATEGCATTVPEGLSFDILRSMEASQGPTTIAQAGASHVEHSSVAALAAALRDRRICLWCPAGDRRSSNLVRFTHWSNLAVCRIPNVGGTLLESGDGRSSATVANQRRHAAF